MYEWRKQIKIIVDEIDRCIKNQDDEALTLYVLSRKLGYSEFHFMGQGDGSSAPIDKAKQNVIIGR